MNNNFYNYQNPITTISFSISKKSIDECYQMLQNRGFSHVEGDIRTGAGKKYVALGYKRDQYLYPITNILGFLSDKSQPETIYENGIEYTKICDDKGNGDIHKGSGGSDLYLYYTRDNRIGKPPIRELIFASYLQKKTSRIEVVQNYSRSKRSGDLDINAERAHPYNYIIVIRY